MDPFSKKDWYDIKAPGAFTVRNVGKTLVTRTAGTKVGPEASNGGMLLHRLAISLELCHLLPFTAKDRTCVTDLTNLSPPHRLPRMA